MLKYIAYRLAMLIPVLFGVAVIVFTLMYVTPGDPTATLLDENATEAERQALREELGIDGSYLEQLWGFFVGLILHFDLGNSYVSGMPVIDLIGSRMEATIALAFWSTLVAAVVGIGLGMVAAMRPNSKLDDIVMTFSLFGVSMPNFWMGLLLMLLFSLYLGWLPAAGFNGWEYLILPVITIATDSAAVIARMTRSAMLEVLSLGYINTARSKGQRESVVLFRHGLRTALMPIATTIGLQFGAMLGGALLTETIFNIPGIGKLLVDSISSRDFPVVQGVVLVIALLFGVVNLLVDLAYAYIDPRVRTQFDLTRRTA